MKCPKCSMGRALTDQVCRRCKYVFDGQRFLEVAPPRASGAAAGRRFFGRPTWRPLAELRDRPWVPPVASIVPGLGHFIQGRPWLGALYGGLVALFLWSAVSPFGGTYAQLLLGMAISTHATCILDTTPWGRAPEVLPRAIGMGTLLLLTTALYWRFAGRLAGLFVTTEYVPLDTRTHRPTGVSLAEQLVLMAILFVISVAASAWAGRRLSSRDE